MISSLELAKLCGVSQGTIDRALHNRKGVSDTTKRNILAMAAKHGYQPNPTARELMTGESRTVGMIIPQLNSFFFMDLANAIKTKLAEHDYRFLLTTIRDAKELMDLLGDFSSRRSRAVVLVPPEDDLIIPQFVAKKLPVITLLNDCRDSATRFVCPDENKTGAQAARYFYDKGHRNVLHLTYARATYSIEARLTGFLKESKRLKMEANVVREFAPDRILSEIRERSITAIFCHNDWLALKLMSALEKESLRVPYDIAVLGVDNSPAFCEIRNDISTMRYPFEWVAEQVLSLVEKSDAKIKKAPLLRIIEKSST